MTGIGFNKWSIGKRIVAGVLLATSVLILSLLLFRPNRATRTILDLPQGSVEILNIDGEKISLEIRVGNPDSTLAGVRPRVAGKAVLYSATPYPASVAKTIKNVNVSIDVALFDGEGGLLEICDVAANSERDCSPEKKYQYTILAYSGFFEEKGVSLRNGSRLLPDTLSEEPFL